MKIAFVSGGYYRADNVGSWSGTPFYMVRALEECGCKVRKITLPPPPALTRDLVAKIWCRFVQKKRLLIDRTPRRLATIQKQLTQELDGIDCDAIISPSSLFIAALPGRVPAVFWTDACFAGMVGFYESFSDLTASSLRQGHEVERRALQRAALALYSSEWAAATARDAYGNLGSRIAVVPFGANMTDAPDAVGVSAAIDRRGGTTLRILFIGVDWERKGGDYACEIVNQARLRGIPAELDIVGCEPPRKNLTAQPWVHSHGFISKATSDGRKRLEELMLSADWLILPTRAECYGMVFAEAAGFGLPSLATAVGGVPTAVMDGKNGYVFPLTAPAEIWVNTIEYFWNDHEQYRALAKSARTEYLGRLNWGVAGKTVMNWLSELVGKRSQVSKSFAQRQPKNQGSIII